MDIEKVKRYSVVEICLLAIFMLGIFAASLIVESRSRVILSDSIPLAGTGLSVSLPAGPGWERTPGWQYEEAENGMTLIGQFGDPTRGRMAVRWRYIFSSPAASERALLEQKVQQIGAVIENVEKIDQEHSMVFARVLLPQTPNESVYMGIIRLDSNRLLELLVRSFRTRGFYAEDVFKSVAGSIQYHSLQDAVDGRGLMDSFVMLQNRVSLSEEAFLIKNTLGKNQGYYYARNLMPQEKWLFRMQIQQHEFNSVKLASEVLFNPSGQEIQWNTKLSNPRFKGVQSYKITTAENGTVSVIRNGKELKTLPAGHIFLPEPLLTEFIDAFLESDYNRVVIDILAARGQLVPVQLTKLAPDKVKIKSDAAKTAVRIDFLYHSNSYEELLFDASGKLLGKSEQQPGRQIRIWDAVSVEVLQQIFPDDFDRNATINLLKRNEDVSHQI